MTRTIDHRSENTPSAMRKRRQPRGHGGYGNGGEGAIFTETDGLGSMYRYLRSSERISSFSANLPRIPALLYVLDLSGVAIFAISGALAGVHRGLDLFGIAVVAAVTAIGGGTLRDLVLNRHPAFWVNDPRYLYVILAATVAAVVGEGYLPSLDSGLLVADAIGLGLFALSGAQIGEVERRSWIVIVLMGTMTGVAGGVIRDLLCGVIPVLLRRDIYASAAIAGIVLYLLLQLAGVRRPWAFIIGILSVVTLRLLARALDWQLPVISHSHL